MAFTRDRDRHHRIVAAALLALLVALGAGGGGARAAAPRVEILSFGEYGPSAKEGTLPARWHQDSLVPVEVTAVPRLLAQTDHLRARPCLRFGLVYRAPDLPGREEVPVTVRVEHPPLRAPDGRESTVDSYITPLGRTVRYAGFEFDEPWEMAPGPWRFALVADGRVLAEQDFTVLPPEQPEGRCVMAVS